MPSANHPKNPEIGDSHRVVPRRRIAAIVHMTDGSTIKGDLYATASEDPQDAEPMLERLNDPNERYLPLAGEDRHYLLNKTSVRFVELARPESSADPVAAARARTFRVVVTLDSGESIGGLLESSAGEVRHRTLDELNGRPRGFLRIVKGAGVAYVNHDHVVSVSDLAAGR